MNIPNLSVVKTEMDSDTVNRQTPAGITQCMYMDTFENQMPGRLSSCTVDTTSDGPATDNDCANHGSGDVCVKQHGGAADISQELVLYNNIYLQL